MVRNLLCAAILAAGVTPTSVQAAHAEATVPLQAGEVSLEVASKGTFKKRADKATLLLTARCKGPTPAAARATVQANSQRLKNALVKVGIPPQAITIEDQPVRAAFVGNEVADLMADAQAAAGAGKPKTYSSTLQIRIALSDISLVSKVRDVLDDEVDPVTIAPAYELSDNRAARNAAIADAVKNARADAEAYAASLGLRITRMLAVRDQSAQSAVFPDYEEVITRFTQPQSATQDVQTTVRVIAEFAAVPR